MSPSFLPLLSLLLPLLIAVSQTSISAFPVINDVPAAALPAPWLDDSLSICHPHGHVSSSHYPTSSVCDPSALLKDKQIHHLDAILSDIYHGVKPYSIIRCSQTPTPVGFRVAVVVVRRMIFDGNTLAKRAEIFSNTLFDSWAMSENCGGAVLFLISRNDHRLYIRTGKLAQQYLSETQIDTISSAIIPYLQKRRLNDALIVGVEKIGSHLSSYHGKHSASDVRNDQPTGAAVPLILRNGPKWWDFEFSLVTIIFVVFAIFACCNGVGGPEAHRKKMERRHVLRKLNTVRSEFIQAMLPQYTPTTCPLCHDDLLPPWVPTVPVLPPVGEAAPLAEHDEDDAPARPLKTLRCGHAFHQSCFDDEYPTSSDSIAECPICGDRGGGISPPLSLMDSRQKDVSFRLKRLQDEYPHIITDDVRNKLISETPNNWPDSMTEAYIKVTPTQQQSLGRQDSDGGNWLSNIWGMLAIGSFGAFLGSLFGNWGDQRDNGSYYQDIPGGSGAQNHRWGFGNGVAGSGGGHGTGWGNSTVSGGGGGAGWGDGGGGAGWGGGGGGGGWGGGGGGGGSGNSGGGHGSGW